MLQSQMKLVRLSLACVCAAATFGSVSHAEDSYFAVGVKADWLKSAPQVERDHIILVDTSASQVGDHRIQAFAVVRDLIASLPEQDRVQLYAIDVAAQALNDEFVAPNDASIEQALTTLDETIPLGATNLPNAINAALKALSSDRAGSVIYVGDGMSAAHLIPAEELQGLVDEMRQRQIPMHSYAVGPRRDLRLLGAIGQFTGGVVMFDTGDDRFSDAADVGRELARAADAPVFYPTKIAMQPNSNGLLPATALPMRADRATVYLGRGDVKNPTVSVDGTTANDDALQTVKIPAKNIESGFSTVGDSSSLGVFYRQAQQDGGLSVAFAGTDLLRGAMVAFDQQAAAQKPISALTVAQVEQPPRPQPPAAGVEPAATFPESDLQAPAADPARTPPPPPAGISDRSGPPSGTLIEQQTQFERINTERMQLDVQRTIERARRFASDDPDGALFELKRLLDVATASTDIQATAKEQMVKRLQAAINDVRAQQQVNEQLQMQARERRATIETERRLVEQSVADENELATLIERVRSLMQEGWHGNDEAFEQAEAVARQALQLRPGNGPATQALLTAEAAGQLSKAYRLRLLRADKFLATLYQVELSHVPFPDEPPILWPDADVWKRLTERRRKWAAVSLFKESASERRIREALDSDTEFQFFEEPLEGVFQYISQQHGIQLLPDWDTMLNEGIEPDTTVTLSVVGIPLRSALRLLLKRSNLTYLIQDDVMKITTQTAADEDPDYLSVRIYPVADLVIPIQQLGGGGGGGFGGGGGGGGFGGGGGGFGGGGAGGGGSGGFGGGGFFSVPSGAVPHAQGAKKAAKPADKNEAPAVKNQEMKQILENVLGEPVSQTKSSGQAFAQVRDDLRLDNSAVQAGKKKAVIER